MLSSQDEHSFLQYLHENPAAAANMSNHYSLKAGKPLSWSRDWDGLQVVHDQNADGLQAVGDQKADGLQALYRNSNQGYPGYNSPSQIGTNGEKGGTRRICGLRATSFWLVCVIVILIVGGGVGGGIGGWLASRKLEYVTKSFLCMFCSDLITVTQ